MRYVFDAYSLDTQRYELRRAGDLIPLGPQVFNVLAYLVAHRDRVVSRDELFARLWPDQFVTDDALGRCIRAARRALEDQPEAPRHITTTRGRDYRFIAPVQEQPHGLPEDEASTTVPAQSIPRPPSTAGSEGLPPPVSLSTVSGELHRLSEEFRLPSLAGEYKQVTVLCGGLADALALAMRLGPEAMHRRMQTVFTIVQQVLHRYAGSLIELSGEGFVALFGAPVAQEDHAQWAVLAALALHAQVGASVPDLRQAPAEPLALCLGLHTGRVVVDRLGGDPQRLYTAAGETTQVALRLRQLSVPGTVLLSAATQHLVQDNVRVEPWGEATVGAAQAPVPVYGVRGIAPQRSGVVGHAALYSGYDPGVCCRMQAAHSLWLLGYPDQAVVSIQAALALAQQLAHPLSLTMALRWAAVLHHLRREAPQTRTHAEAAITMAVDQGFPQQVAIATPLRGWALAATGQGEEGIAQIHQGLVAFRATGATRDRPEHLALLAEASAQVGQTTEGLVALAEMLATLDQSEMRLWEAELYRLRGELLLQQTVAQSADAEVCFQRALAVARRQQARSWELRAALSLARLWQQQGKRAEACELLAPIYGWFTEGFDTADLQEAKALLAELEG